MNYFEELFENILKSMAGEDGEIIRNAGGYIDIRHTNAKYSPRSQSIIDFFVDENKRGKGFGKDLIHKAMKKYPNLGGQASSRASIKIMYDAGMRNPTNPDATLDDLFRMKEEWSSVYMALKDRNGIPYVK